MLDYLPKEAYDEAYNKDLDLSVKHALGDNSNFYVKVTLEGQEPIFASHYREAENGKYWVTLYLKEDDIYLQKHFELQDVKVIAWEKRVKKPEPIPEETEGNIVKVSKQ